MARVRPVCTTEPPVNPNPEANHMPPAEFTRSRSDRQALIADTFPRRTDCQSARIWRSHGYIDIVWYDRVFQLPADWAGRRVLLHFGAVDYLATVGVNGVFVTQHEGGHVPFSVY